MPRLFLSRVCERRIWASRVASRRLWFITTPGESKQGATDNPSTAVPRMIFTFSSSWRCHLELMFFFHSLFGYDHDECVAIFTSEQEILVWCFFFSLWARVLCVCVYRPSGIIDLMLCVQTNVNNYNDDNNSVLPYSPLHGNSLKQCYSANRSAANYEPYGLLTGVIWCCVNLCLRTRRSWFDDYSF